METTSNIKQQVRINLLIHQALIAELVILIVIAYYLVISKTITAFIEPDMHKILLVAFLVFAMLIFFAGRLIVKQRIKLINGKTGLDDKLKEYRTLSIIQWAMLEGVGVLSVVIFMITAEKSFLIFTLLVIVFMMASRPTRNRIAQILSLSDKELEELG